MIPAREGFHIGVTVVARNDRVELPPIEGFKHLRKNAR